MNTHSEHHGASGLGWLWSICKRTVKAWNDDRIPLHGAALAFYSVLSIGPVLLIIMSVAGLVFGHDATSGYMIGQTLIVDGGLTLA